MRPRAISASGRSQPTSPALVGMYRWSVVSKARASARCQRPPSQYVGLRRGLRRYTSCTARTRRIPNAGSVLASASRNDGSLCRCRCESTWVISTPASRTAAICAAISFSICATGSRRASARSRTVRVGRKRPSSSTRPGISSGSDSGRSSPSPTKVRCTPTSTAGCSRAYATASAVAGIAGMRETLVRAPRSRHSMVACTVSFDAPKSSACRTMRIARQRLRSSSCRRP